MSDWFSNMCEWRNDSIISLLRGFGLLMSMIDLQWTEALLEKAWKILPVKLPFKESFTYSI